MRIFITGLSGYVGTVLAYHLSKLPDVECITGISRSAPKKRLPEKVQFLSMDMRSPELSKVAAGYDILIHTAFTVLWPKRIPVSERDDINLNGVSNVARAAVSNRIKQFIHISSIGAYDPVKSTDQVNVTEDFPLCSGDSYFYYSNGKGLAEKSVTEILKEADTKLTILRPSYVIGPINWDTIPTYRKSLVKPPGKNPRLQFVHEDDLFSATLLALQKDLPGAYNVAADDCVTLSELASIIGLKRVQVVPIWLARFITAIRWNYFGSSVHPSWVNVTYQNTSYSNTRLKAVGWKPRYSSREAICSALEQRE